jgi:hypothetical protein
MLGVVCDPPEQTLATDAKKTAKSSDDFAAKGAGAT